METASQDRFVQKLYDAARKFDVYRPEEYPETLGGLKMSKKRRLRRGEEDDPRVGMTLTDTDGVLRWVSGYGYAENFLRRRGRRARVVPGDQVAPINFERLEEGQLTAYLLKLDRHFNSHCDPLTPATGLRTLQMGAKGVEWGPGNALPRKSGRILLFVHGTFSKNQPFLDQLKQTAEGKDLLVRILNRKNYQQVLGFEHPTLSVSPWINALDLGHLFADSKADVDVIAHSRGGLVTRWWLEEIGHRTANSRAVLVGAPLGGTSLASPPRLRAALNLLTNIAHVLETGTHLAASMIPFLEVVAALLKIVGAVGTLTSKTPLVDASLSIIPGLYSQSKMSNNIEVARLNRTTVLTPDYYAAVSDFEPQEVGWNFWRYFTQIGDHLKDTAADLVFDEPNDLVVDKPSMVTLSSQDSQIRFQKVLEFEKKDRVHHTIYFTRPETARFIIESLGLKR